MRNKYILFLICGMLSFSSCVDEEQPATPGGQEISLDFPVSVAAMQAAGDGPATRSAMSPEEKAIHSLYVVQFNGSATTSTVVKAGSATVPGTDGKVGYSFTATGGNCRVYVIANATPSVAVGSTTLAAFEKMMAVYAPTVASVASTGLPMSGHADFNPATVTTAPTITLKAMVAKLVVKYTVAPEAVSLFKAGTTPAITLKNVPTGTAFGAPADVSAAYRPAGVGFSDIPVGPTGETTYTCYVPENIAGIGAGATLWSKRIPANAPANALYLEIGGRTPGNFLVTIVSYIGDPSKPTEFNILRNTCYTLTATINDLNSLDERITLDCFDLNVGGESANCYIVTGNELGSGTKQYTFNYTVRGNNATSVAGINYNSLPDLSTATEARVLWQTGGIASVIKSVALDKSSGKVWFTLGDAVEGNAVIGVFANSAANAPCLWSWHIWRLNGAAPGTVACTKTLAPTSFEMMDRNLGAYNNTEGDFGSIGLLYQWGRKDPFPGSAAFSTTEPNNIYGSFNRGGTTGNGNWSGLYTIQAVTTNLTVGTELYAVNYPTIFIAGTSTNGNNDWYWGSRNNNLWGTPWTTASNYYNMNQGTKSIYDPCPIGYRVPPQDTWSMEVNPGTSMGSGIFRNNGIVLSKMAANFWFPAAVSRIHSGEFPAANASSIIGYWASSPSGGTATAQGGCMAFSGEKIIPRIELSRAYGLPVRCVSNSVSQ